MADEKLMKLYRKLSLYDGDASAAMSLAACYMGGINGYEKDMEKSFYYLTLAADLCHPTALHTISQAYLNGKYMDLSIGRDVQKAEKYLRLLAYVTDIVDVSKFEKEDIDQVNRDRFYAYSRLGLLYMEEEVFQNRWLGSMISLDGAERHQLPLSYYAMGYWFAYCEESGNIYSDYQNALGWLNSAVRSAMQANDKTVAREAALLYNDIAEYLNDRSDADNQIQYWNV